MAIASADGKFYEDEADFFLQSRGHKQPVTGGKSAQGQDLDRPLGPPNRSVRPPTLPGAKGEYLTSENTIPILRHGETAENEKNIAHGWSDEPLTEKGRQQVLASAVKLMSGEDESMEGMVKIGKQFPGYKPPGENEPGSENIEDKRNPTWGEYLSYMFLRHSPEQVREMLNHPMTRTRDLDPEAKAYHEKIVGPNLPDVSADRLAKAAGYDDINENAKKTRDLYARGAKIMVKADEALSGLNK